MDLLRVEDLEVSFNLRKGVLKAIRGISFDLKKGERIGIVGESGAGKSVAAFSILNLIAKPGQISRGHITYKDAKLSHMSDKELASVRGNQIAMIFQDPMMTLNPVFTIGTQMVETLQAHRKISKKDAEIESLKRLKQVQIPSPEQRLKQYPHELSGGMKQRVIIAIALLNNPDIIIADEPTTALDVTIQAEIMDLLLDLCKSSGVSLILITHDLGVVAQTTEKVLVMYAGKIIESGPTRDIIENPNHPYTRGLIKALPQKAEPGDRLYQIPGSMPQLNSIPTGCAFNPRCEHVTDNCKTIEPELVAKENSMVSCHLYSGGHAS